LLAEEECDDDDDVRLGFAEPVECLRLNGLKQYNDVSFLRFGKCFVALISYDVIVSTL